MDDQRTADDVVQVQALAQRVDVGDAIGPASMLPRSPA